MIIDGKAIAGEILNDLKTRVNNLKEKRITPTLQIILVGENTQSESYVRQKKLKGEEIEIKVNVLRLESGINNLELLKTIEQLNNDNNVNGIIIQRPLPIQINSNEIDQTVLPEKDVDGFNKNSKFHPPLGEAIITLLKSVDKDFKTKKIVIIGKGKTGGEPVIKTFKKLGINFNVVDRSTHNSSFIIHNSDIIISAVGKPNTIKPEMIKKNAILISIGLYKGNDGKLYGDYDEEKIKDIASFYTPTPGGVGPVNVACLLKNVIEAAKNR